MKVLRWILVLPVALAGFLFVLFGGVIAVAVLSEEGVVAATPDSLPSYFTAMVLNASGGLVMIWGAMKTAPSGRRVVGESLLCLLLIYYWYTYSYTPAHFGLFNILKDLAVFAGGWFGYSRIAGTWRIRGLE